jgi:hypothetical protein
MISNASEGGVPFADTITIDSNGAKTFSEKVRTHGLAESLEHPGTAK